MAFGLGRLRLTSAAFWAMTPREMAAAMRGMSPESDGRIGRAELAHLMNKHPDSEAGKPHP